MSASPSRVVDSVGSFDERKAFWEEKDLEEKKKRESIASSASIEEEGGFENNAFMGADRIDSITLSSTTAVAGSPPGIAPRGSISDSQEKLPRTPSPYEIERNKEAIFLDTDDVEPGEEEEYEEDEDDIDQDTRVEVETEIKKQILQAHLAEGSGEEFSPERKGIFQLQQQQQHQQRQPEPSSTEVKQHSTRQVIEVEEQKTVQEEIKDGSGLTKEVKTTTETVIKTTTVEKSEYETSEKYNTEPTSYRWEQETVVTTTRQEPRLIQSSDEEDSGEIVRHAASSLVSEIEEKVQEQLGGDSRFMSSATSVEEDQPPPIPSRSNIGRSEVRPSEPSSVDITDEELLSTGDISSPEPLKVNSTSVHAQSFHVLMGS